MRADSIGFFWQDNPDTKRTKPLRAMPAIPKSTWRAPTAFPNLSSAPYISIDTETWDPELLDYGPGWARKKGHIVGVSVAVPGKSWYFPVRHEVLPEQNMQPEHVFSWLRDTLGDKSQPKLGANLIYDVGWLMSENVALAGKLYDVQFAEALLDEAAPTSLDTLGNKYLQRGKDTNALYDWSALYYGGKADEQRKNIYRCPPCLVGPYAEADAELPALILPIQWKLMEREALLEIFEMECALIPLLLAMRKAGVSVDIDKACLVKEQLSVEAAELQQKLKHLVGFDVNVNASDSLQKAFEAQGIPIPQDHTGKRTFAKEMLSQIEHVVPETVLAIKRVRKIADTFIQSYVLDSHVNGRVHGEFHPLRSDRGGTRSGRLSSSNPNLQNLPSRDEKLAPLVRGVFVPHEGHVRWRKYDQSQIEYRALAHFAIGSGAENLRHKFTTDPDTDYHELTLDLVAPIAGWDISTKDKRKNRRKPIKNINFGLLYGMGEPKLMRQLGLDKLAGKELFKAYHEAAPFTIATMRDCASFAETFGYITTILGRRSRFDLWVPDNKSRVQSKPLPLEQAQKVYGHKLRRASTHKALNRRLQGSAADQMKKAMLALWESGVLQITGVPTLTVHDELDFSDTGDCDDAFDYVKHIMETALPFRVPLKAELETGTNWGNCH